RTPTAIRWISRAGDANEPRAGGVLSSAAVPDRGAARRRTGGRPRAVRAAAAIGARARDAAAGGAGALRRARPATTGPLRTAAARERQRRRRLVDNVCGRRAGLQRCDSGCGPPE